MLSPAELKSLFFDGGAAASGGKIAAALSCLDRKTRGVKVFCGVRVAGATT
jgi:hypothetical protein